MLLFHSYLIIVVELVRVYYSGQFFSANKSFLNTSKLLMFSKILKVLNTIYFSDIIYYFCIVRNMSDKDSSSDGQDDGGALGALRRFRLLGKKCPNLDTSSDSSTSSHETKNKSSSSSDSISNDPAAAKSSFIFESTRDFLAFLDLINKAAEYDPECIIRIEFTEQGIEVTASSFRYLQIIFSSEGSVSNLQPELLQC